MQVQGYCTLCRSRCGTLNTVEGGRLLRVDPDTSHPTGQAMCSKGRAAPEIAFSSRRLTAPMRRTRPKGDPDPGWREIGWDEAMTEVAARLAAHRDAGGAESVAFGVTSPSGAPISDAIDWIERFFRLFGSPNCAYSTEICNWHKDYAHAFTYGMGITTPDYANAELILLWGHNPASVWLSQAGAVAQGQRNGAKLVVVDPRRTAHAAQADHWLRVRPGTDGALALGLIRQLIATGGYDAGFVRRWTNGGLLVRCDDGTLLRRGADHLVLDERSGRALPFAPDASPALRGTFEVDGVRCRPAFDLLAAACEPYTPARVEALTTVPAATVVAAAEAIARAKSVAYYCWTGVGQHSDATQVDRAIAILTALTGTWDAPGANREYRRQPTNKVNGFDLLAPAQAAKALGRDKRPLGPPSQGWVATADLYDAILHAKPYPVRALVTFGANMLVTHADPARAQAALAALDFHVHCDLFETPTARFADILLPANSPWEREGLRVGFEINAGAEELVQLRRQMVPPVGQSRSDMAIVFDLAVRLGMAEPFFGGSTEAGWDHMLAPLGLTVAELRRHPGGIRRPLAQEPRRYAHRAPAFPTQTGLVELYSERLHRHGYPAVPTFEPPSDGPDASFPLVLTTAKSGYYCHSQQRGISSLRKRAAEPAIEVAPELAEARGIAEGDWVAVRSRAGAARFRAKVSPALHPGVAVADYGWWQPCADLGLPGYDPAADTGSNYNALISAAHADPLSGSVPMRAAACEVTRLGAPLPHGWRSMRVAELAPEADGVVSVTLAATDGEPLRDFRPGQHLPISLDIDGHGAVTRSYSLSGPAVVPGRDAYRISVKRADGGIASGHITGMLRVGDAVLAKAPGGSFVIPTRAEFPVVMLAAGIGITPFMSALETLARADAAARRSAPALVLHYGNRDGAGHAFRDRLRRLRPRLPTLTVVDRYSRPSPADRDVERGRLTADVVAPELIAARARFYLCGPPEMLRDVTAGLIARGVPKFEVFSESFGSGPAATPAALPDTSHEVRFSRSGAVHTWHPTDGSLLDFGERHGVTMPSGCRVGQCESCAVGVLAGDVAYLGAIGNAEPGECLTCRAVPASALVLDA